MATATLIRHASCDQATAVLPLAVAVVEPALGASLVPAIGRSSLLPPCFVSATVRAIPLPPVAGTAQIEHHTTGFGSAETLSERDLPGGRQSPPQSRARQRTAVMGSSTNFSCAASLRGSHTKPRSPAKDDRGFVSQPCRAGAYFLRPDAPSARMMTALSFASRKTAVSDERLQEANPRSVATLLPAPLARPAVGLGLRARRLRGPRRALRARVALPRLVRGV